ncbi:hypothetical protein F5877DRAFT_73122 [Lentinula edodes]|nr:hypothetical protein F5877DRAFT_73122 [Lentinula edodes]
MICLSQNGNDMLTWNSQKLSEGNPYPQANSSSWTTSKKFSLWPSKGELRNPMTANVEKSQDVFWYLAMKTPPPKNSVRLFHFPWNLKTACRRNAICWWLSDYPWRKIYSRREFGYHFGWSDQWSSQACSTPSVQVLTSWMERTGILPLLVLSRQYSEAQKNDSEGQAGSGKVDGNIEKGKKKGSTNGSTGKETKESLNQAGTMATANLQSWYRWDNCSNAPACTATKQHLQSRIAWQAALILHQADGVTLQNVIRANLGLSQHVRLSKSATITSNSANQPAQTSVFGSGSGNVATGFGAFNGLREALAEWDESARGMPRLVVISKFRGSFGVSGNTGNTTNMLSLLNRLLSLPTVNNIYPDLGLANRHVSGTILVRKAEFRTTFIRPIEANRNQHIFSSSSNAGGDGFASFAGTPSTFASAASSGKSAFGGGRAAERRRRIRSSQPAPSTSQVAFRDRESVPSTTSLRKSEPGSPTIPYSPDPDIPDSDIVIPSAFPVKATTTMTKSLLSPFGSLSSARPVFSANLSSASTDPTYGDFSTWLWVWFPTRSSSLSNKPLTGAEEQDDEEAEEEPKSIAVFKPRPASPKTQLRMIPAPSGSTSPDETKLINGKRPKTPPLMPKPTAPKPAAASLPGPATQLKPPRAS